MHEKTTTSIDVRFRTVEGDFLDSSLLKGSIHDHRSYLNVILSGDAGRVVNAAMFVDTAAKTTLNVQQHELELAQNKIGSADTVSARDVQFDFDNEGVYSIKIRAIVKDEDGHMISAFATFSMTSSDAERSIDNANVYLYHHITNPDILELELLNSDEIQDGGKIELAVKFEAGLTTDTRRPEKVMFTLEKFDYANEHEAGAVNLDIDRIFSSYVFNWTDGVVYGPPVDKKYKFVIPDVTLVNDSAYTLTGSVAFCEGNFVGATLPASLDSLAKPEIKSAIAYGIHSNKKGAGDEAGEDGISTVFKARLLKSDTPIHLVPKGGRIKFFLSQAVVQDDEVVEVDFYNAEFDLATEGVAVIDNGLECQDFTATFDKIFDTPLFDATDPAAGPKREANGRTKLNLRVEYIFTKTDGTDLVKTSDALALEFTSDIIPVQSVSHQNAWIAASVTVVDDVSEATEVQNYKDSPDYGMIVTFSKNDYSGSGKQSGLFQDLDLPGTKYRVEYRKNGDGPWFLVTNAALIQADGTKSDQDNAMDAIDAELVENLNGLYDNVTLPAEAGKSGSTQTPLVMYVPQLNEIGVARFVQEDSIMFRVSIISEKNELTEPAPAVSAGSIVVGKKPAVYEMAPGSAAEPYVSGPLDALTAYIPVVKMTSEDIYAEYANIFTNEPDYTENNDLATDGTPLDIENPSHVGKADPITYMVQYLFSDPSPNGAQIICPMSEEYSFHAQGTPIKDDFSITDFDFTTILKEDKSSVSYTVNFNDNDATVIDGVQVFFKSENSSNERLVGVHWNDGSDPEKVIVLVNNALNIGALQSEPLAVKVRYYDFEGAAPTYGESLQELLDNESWANFANGQILFKPFKTKKFSSLDDSEIEVSPDTAWRYFEFANVMSIDPAANAYLKGGIVQHVSGTTLVWNKVVAAKLNGLSTNNAFKWNFEVDGTDNSDDVYDFSASQKGYDYDLIEADGGTLFSSVISGTLTVNLTQDGVPVQKEYNSEEVKVDFTCHSVDMKVTKPVIARGTKANALKVTFARPAVIPSRTEFRTDRLELHDRGAKSNTDASTFTKLVEKFNAIVQESPEEYNLVSTHNKGDLLRLIFRLQAHILYTKQVGAGAEESKETDPEWLENLSSDYDRSVRKANSPLLHVESVYAVVGNKIVVSLNADLNGMEAEGAKAMTVLAAQSGELGTVSDDSPGGADGVFNFTASTVTGPTYDVPENEASPTDSTDNLAAGEELVTTALNDEDIEATLKLGSLDSNDESTLELSTDNFDPSKDIELLMIVQTGRGTAFKSVTVYPE